MARLEQEMAKGLPDERGFSILELLCAMCLMAIITAISVYGLKAMDNPLADAAFSVHKYLDLVRSEAIGRTSAIVISPASSTSITATQGPSCTSATTAANDLRLNLPNGAHLTDTSWSICFTQRGLTDATAIISITDALGAHRLVRVALGGGNKIDDA